MKSEEKTGLWIRATFELIFVLSILRLIFHTASYNTAVFSMYHERVKFSNAFTFIAFNNFQAIKILVEAIFMLVLAIVGTIISFRTSFRASQTIMTWSCLILNFSLFVWLIIVLSNPILVAIFILAVIGAAFSQISQN